MKDIIKRIALQAGGSHYPTVGGELLQKFSDLMLEECIKAIKNTSRNHALTSYDRSMVDATIEKTVESIREHFKL